jgi:hypothetical protein
MHHARNVLKAKNLCEKQINSKDNAHMVICNIVSYNGQSTKFASLAIHIFVAVLRWFRKYNLEIDGNIVRRWL